MRFSHSWLLAITFIAGIHAYLTNNSRIVPEDAGIGNRQLAERESTLGLVAGIVGLIASTIGLIASAMSFNNMATKKHNAEVRVYLGKGNRNSHMSGRVPSPVLWDVNGKRLGYDHKHGKIINPGNFRDVTVHTHHTNERSEYMMIAAQRKGDPICVAAIGIAHPDGESKDVLFGDTVTNCGGPWSYQTSRIGKESRATTCFWLSSAHKRIHNTDDAFPDGISWHITSFIGSNERAKQYQEHPETMCNKTARFALQHDLRHGKKHRIDIFKNPLKLTSNMTDVDLGAFMREEQILSDPVNHDSIDWHKRRHTTDVEGLATTSSWVQHMMNGVEKGHQSAKVLCESPTAVSADWYSHEEKMLCRMSDRTLLPACGEDVKGDCFDNDSNHIRGKKGCPDGKVCTQSEGAGVLKKYAWVDDATKDAPADGGDEAEEGRGDVQQENNGVETEEAKGDMQAQDVGVETEEAKGDVREQDGGAGDNSTQWASSRRLNRFRRA